MNASGISARSFLLTWIALIVLALASFLISFVHLGPWSTPVALFLAGIKAVLVALVFMELIAQGVTSRLALIVAVAFALILTALAAGDVLTREAPPLRPSDIHSDWDWGGRRL